MSFGEKIKKERLSRGLSQEALAKELYVSRQAVTKWEGNEAKPDINTIEAIAKYFNVTLDYLLEESPNKSGNSNNRKNKHLIPYIIFSSLIILVLIIVAIVAFLTSPREAKEAVAFYISLDQEYVASNIADVKKRNLPYIDAISDSYNLFYPTNDSLISYELKIPKESFNTLYAYNIYYDNRRDEYSTEGRAILSDMVASAKFMLGEYHINICTEEPYQELEVYSYGVDYSVIKHEIFKVNEKGEISSSLAGLINEPYLFSYSVANAIQYTVILKNSNDKKIINVMSELSVHTYLAPKASRLSPYGYFTSFIF